MRPIVLTSILFFFSVLTAMSQTTSNIVSVTVDGYSYMGEEETIKVAKERAMKDAERKAVEEGTGLYLEAYSKIHNYMTVEDDIKSLAAGYIVSKKVLLDTLEATPLRYHVRILAEVKCGDLEKLADTQKTAEPAPRKMRPLSVQFTLVAERMLPTGDWEEVVLQDGGTLKSHDKFQLHLQPSMDGYLYLLLYDSHGKASLLFPRKNTSADYLVKKGTEIRIPGPTSFYEVDSSPGNKTIFLIASLHPLDRLQWLLERMEKSGEIPNPTALAKILRARSVLRKTSGSKVAFALSDGKRADQAGEVLMGHGTLVRKLSFRVVN